MITPEVRQAIEEVLRSVGLTEDIDQYTATYLDIIYDLALRNYLKDQSEGQLASLHAKLGQLETNELKTEYLIQILQTESDNHYLSAAAEQVTRDFVAAVNS